MVSSRVQFIAPSAWLKDGHCQSRLTARPGWVHLISSSQFTFQSGYTRVSCLRLLVFLVYCTYMVKLTPLWWYIVICWGMLGSVAVYGEYALSDKYFLVALDEVKVQIYVSYAFWVLKHCKTIAKYFNAFFIKKI